MKRFTVGPSVLGERYPVIRDGAQGRAFPFGPTYNFSNACGTHRSSYTIDDADVTVDWLNERAAGYPASTRMVLP